MNNPKHFKISFGDYLMLHRAGLPDKEGVRTCSELLGLYDLQYSTKSRDAYDDYFCIIKDPHKAMLFQIKYAEYLTNSYFE